MIITRTPFRVSLLGGSTDFASWYEQHGGLVVGSTIDKYSFVTVRHLPPFHNYKHRVVYSETETVNDVDKLKHKAVGATIKYMDCHHDGLEIFHAADLPGRSGIGSSSSFVVGLLNALNALKNKRVPPDELAEDAVHIERNILGEAGGCQDQTFAAHGGLNVIRFRQNGNVSVFPLTLSTDHIRELERHLLLVFTGVTRTSSEVAESYAGTLGKREKEGWAMVRLAEQGIEAVYRHDYRRLGDLVDQSWRIKCGLSNKVTNQAISDAYVTARLHGAYGGKLTGAGGGGMMLLVAHPDKHEAIIKALPGYVHVPFRFEFDGSQVIFVDR